MRTSMLSPANRWRTALLIRTLLLAGSAVQAEHTAAQGLLPPPRPPALTFPSQPPETMFKRTCDDLDAVFAARTAFIETKVAPTAAQKSEWDVFVAALRTIAREAQSRCDAQETLRPPVDDPVAMLAFHDSLAAQHAEYRKIERAAANRLMQALTPEQKRKLAEALLPRPFMSPMAHPAYGMPPL